MINWFLVCLFVCLFVFIERAGHVTSMSSCLLSVCFLTQNSARNKLKSDNEYMYLVNWAFFCHGRNYFSVYHSEIYCIKQNNMLQSNFYELSTFYFFTQKGKKCITSFSTVSLGKRNMRATLRTFLMGSCTLNTSQRMDSSSNKGRTKAKGGPCLTSDKHRWCCSI